MKDPDLDLKIIHLIRDPRAVARSRKSIHTAMTDAEIVKNITSMCYEQMLSHQLYATNNNYIPILYEDTNRLPNDEAAKIFDFVSLPVAPEVKTWIYQNSGQQYLRKARGRRSLNVADFHLKERIDYDDKSIFLYEDNAGHNFTKTKFNLKKSEEMMRDNKLASDLFLEEKQESPKPKIPIKSFHTVQKAKTGGQIAARRRAVNPFGTKRIASNVLERWPGELDYNLVIQIQSGCSELMETFGYKFIQSEEGYADKSKSYLPELEDLPEDGL